MGADVEDVKTTDLSTEAPTFKQCTTCFHGWSDRDSFLSDPAIKVIGYQVNYIELEKGLFLFNHEIPKCGNTMAIEVNAFSDLYDGPIFNARLENSGRCGDNCLHESNLIPCPMKCECAYVRQVLDIVDKWPKNNA